MKRALQFVFVIAGAFLAGTLYNHRTAANAGRKVLYYSDPMHPAYRSDKPGIAPDCGMALEPVYAGAVPRGSVQVSTEMQQLGGVRVARVEKRVRTRTLRLFGRIAADETRIYNLNAGIDGFIQEVSPVTTGSRVKKQQLLATFSAPNATMTVQTYILNVGAEDHFKKSVAQGSVEAQSLPAAAANIQQRVQQLQNLGMSLQQVEDIKRTRRVPDTIQILAPADGLVLERNVSPGQKFDRGALWYRIADLSRVWIVADVFRTDARFVRPGLRAQVSLPDENTTIPAAVSEVLPQFDPNSRTLKVRLEAANPKLALLPDMVVDAILPVAVPAAIAVPVDAVVDSGLNKRVFVERGEGTFEPRQIETGARFGDEVEVLSGLEPGDRVVISGNFLLDSESRLRNAATVKDPVCHMDLAPAQAAASVNQDINVFYFCSKSCRDKFNQDPRKYGGGPRGAGT